MLLLSCISTRQSLMNAHWARAAAEGRPPGVLGSHRKPPQDLGGLLCLIGPDGAVLRIRHVRMPASLVGSADGVLVTSIWSVHETATDLSWIRENVMSLPLFNSLHWISASSRGYLLASTGLDLILELDAGGEVLWEWWAEDHGFVTAAGGGRRHIDRSADHRGIEYGTLAQAAHLNSVVELPDGRLLASMFHQGNVISIDRTTGRWVPLLERLDHPHALRLVEGGLVTVADTGRGRALLLRPGARSATVLTSVDAGTSWLQDCHFEPANGHWTLLDARRSRLVIRRGLAGDYLVREVSCDPEWRLYSVLPLPAQASETTTE